MDYLLVGGMSNFMDSVIEKLNKEGHRVFVLTGSKYNSAKYSRVFERYDFPYDSVVLKEIVESIHPDGVVFFGAYDTNYRYATEQHDVVSYSTGLVNLLMVLATLPNLTRFIYLSSEQVFAPTDGALIPETAEASPVSYLSQAVHQGEVTALSYKDNPNVDPIVVRLDHIYGRVKSRMDLAEPFYSMCNQGLTTGRILVNEDRKISLLHDKEACQYIYVLLTTQEHKRSLYHISSGNTFTEAQIAKLLARGMEVESVEIEGSMYEKGPQKTLVLEDTYFKDEFKQAVFDHPDKMIPEIGRTVKRNAKKLYEPEEEDRKIGFFGKLLRMMEQALPYLENILLFIPFFMLNNRATGSQYFANLDFYLIYVLLFAILFGQIQATFSAVLATAGYIFRQQYTRSGFDVMLDYNTYVWIAQLFIFGLVVGYLDPRRE